MGITRSIGADARGVGMTEYALIVALVALVALGAWNVLGGAVSSKTQCAADAIATGNGGPCVAMNSGGGNPSHDGIDNDHDGQTDEPGEAGPPGGGGDPSHDGIDNDHDGQADEPGEPGESGPSGDGAGVDNDHDGPTGERVFSRGGHYSGVPGEGDSADNGAVAGRQAGLQRDPGGGGGGGGETTDDGQQIVSTTTTQDGPTTTETTHWSNGTTWTQTTTTTSDGGKTVYRTETAPGGRTTQRYQQRYEACRSCPSGYQLADSTIVDAPGSWDVGERSAAGQRFWRPADMGYAPEGSSGAMASGGSGYPVFWSRTIVDNIRPDMRVVYSMSEVEYQPNRLFDAARDELPGGASSMTTSIERFDGMYWRPIQTWDENSRTDYVYVGDKTFSYVDWGKDGDYDEVTIESDGERANVSWDSMWEGDGVYWSYHHDDTSAWGDVEQPSSHWWCAWLCHSGGGELHADGGEIPADTGIFHEAMAIGQHPNQAEMARQVSSSHTFRMPALKLLTTDDIRPAPPPVGP